MGFVFYFCAFAQDVITFEWEVGTDEKSFELYFNYYSEFTVNWGDNSNIDTYNGVINSVPLSHSYVNAGTYTVAIADIMSNHYRLYCSNNQINNIDVSGTTALAILDCSNNQINSLNTSGATTLSSLECQNNQLISLDLSTNTALAGFNCSNNPQLKNLYFSNSKSLGVLRANNCTALEALDCSNNQISELQLNNCTALKYLDCSNNSLSDKPMGASCFQFYGSPLEYLDCSYNHITLFPIFGSETLTTLYCNNNGNNYGETVFLQDMLNNSPLLHTLDCSFNLLRELDFSNNSALEYLKCDNSYLSSLKISHNTELQYLYCNDNFISDLDLSNNQALTKIECYSNRLLLSNLYYISEMISDKSNKFLGTQNVEIPSAIVGHPLFADQAEFNNILTNYTITSRLYPFDPDYYPVPESYYTITNGEITFNNIGDYLVKLTNDAIISNDDYPAEMIVYLNVTSGAGINENSISNIEVFPNPTNGEFSVRTASFGIENIQIFDATGKNVWEKNGKLQTEEIIKIDISHLSSGIYFVKAGGVVKKVIKE
jgi:Leucine-rich repeat (LRR) protein